MKDALARLAALLYLRGIMSIASFKTVLFSRLRLGARAAQIRA